MTRLRSFFLVMLLATFALAQPKPDPKATLSPDPLVPGQNATLTIRVDIPAGFHAQSNEPLDENLIPFKVVVNANDGLTVGKIQYPLAETKTYPAIGAMSVFGGEVTVTVPLTVDAGADVVQLSLSAAVTYQICDDAGSCFAPQTRTIEILKSSSASPTALPPPTLPVPTLPPPTVVSPEVGLFGYSVSLSSFWVAIPVAMVIGLLFNVMPCVLPVLPLKAMGFYEASQHARGRAIAFGAAFSIGLIAVFVALAIFVLASRTLLGQHFQWGQWFAYAPFVWGMTIVLVLLGMSMLGAFMIPVPTALYGLSFRHDTMTGNFLWGVLTALLSTPCTAPMFAGLITWAVGQPIALGVVAMLAVGVGMALPYFILSAFPQIARRFPRTGPASELVKQAMAFPLLGTAAWLIGPRIVEDPAHWWLVVAVAVWGAMFVMIRAAQILKSSGGVLVTTALSVLVVGATVLVAIRFNPIEGTSASSVSASGETWTKYSDEALANALQSGQPVVVKFTASWCANCQVIEATVYRDDQTLAELHRRGVILIKADLTTSDAAGWKQLNALGFTGIPLTAIYLPGSDKPHLFDAIYTSQDLLAALPAGASAQSRSH